jgi:hypothetical protein
MKTLDVQARLEYARAAVAVLRALRISDSKMRYGEFAKAIGLMADGESWEVWHRTQTRDILNLVAATERQAGPNTEIEPIQFERLVTADGEPGTGFYKTSRIVTE